VSHLQAESGVDELSCHADAEPLASSPLAYSAATAASLNWLDRTPGNESTEVVDVQVAGSCDLLIGENSFAHS